MYDRLALPHSGRSRAWLAALVTAFCLGAGSNRLDAQLQLASVTAVVLDERGIPVRAAVVMLTDPLGAQLQVAETDASGRALFAAVVPGRYEVRTTAPGLANFSLPAIVTGALPLEITVRIPAAVTDQVIVEGADTDEALARNGVAGDSLDRVPVRARSRGLQDVVATLPGWSTEDNGLLHARGVDDGYLYVIDGVPVYERIDAVSGIAPDLSSVSSVTVITGYIPPEFGLKSGGVIEVRSASGADTWMARTETGLGSDASREIAAVAGGGLGHTADLRAGVAWARSTRYLDPVHPDNFHNSGGQTSTFGQLGWAPTATSRVTAGWGLGRTLLDVPNNAVQQEAGQDQRQRIGQGSVNLTWQRTWSADLVTQTAAYHRRSTGRLDGSVFDTPLEAHANRRLSRTGVIAAATRQQAGHLVKAGVEWQRLVLDEAFRFAVTSPEAAERADLREQARAFGPDNPFRFQGRSTPTLWSAYLQDSWRAMPALTLSGGLRYDRTGLLLSRSQWSPRAGAAIRVRPRTTVRAALSRFFQPPQPENLLLSSSPEARVLSAVAVGGDQGGADLEPERQWGTEVGFEHRWTRLRLDAAYWRRWIADAADPNVFAGTTIIFPNAVAEGRAHGLDVRLEMPGYRGWSGYANWGLSRVVQTGPITGGLFLDDDVESIGPGVEFVPDHDQRVTVGAGVSWANTPSGVLVSLAARYESGTPVPRDADDELREQPGADLVDFDAGRVRPRMLVSLAVAAPIFTTPRARGVLGLQVLNLLDARYAYNFGNPFSGTHFGAPRTVAVTLRVMVGS